MKLTNKKYTLYITLKQCFTKYKKKHSIFNLTFLNKTFANFLSKKNYIYGYTNKKYKKNTTYLYLKYNTSFNTYSIKKDTKLYRISNLHTLFIWEKNVYFLLKTIKGIFTPKEAFLTKIGGYSLFKIN